MSLRTLLRQHAFAAARPHAFQSNRKEHKPQMTENPTSAGWTSQHLRLVLGIELGILKLCVVHFIHGEAPSARR